MITTTETLVHFKCPDCQGWWTIGDAPERDFWFCPWCGKKLTNETEAGGETYTYPEILENTFPDRIEVVAAPDGSSHYLDPKAWTPEEARWIRSRIKRE